jgi:hypothetical protein
MCRQEHQSEQSITEIMDKFFDVVNAGSARNGNNTVMEMVRLAGRFDSAENIEALVRLLVIEHTRRRCLEAKLEFTQEEGKRHV